MSASPVTSAPGRVCLLGEHNDWAGGASLAAPLPMGVTVRASPSEGDLSASSALEGVQLEGRWPVEGAVLRAGGPLRFVPAAAYALARRGIGPVPAHLDVTSDLPAGRGFSSSAAFSIAVLDALARLAGHALPALELAELAYEVEHDWLGVACGRLDQLASALGRAGPEGPAAALLRWEGGEARQVERVPVGARLPLVVGAFSAPRDTPGILAALNDAFFGRCSDGAAVQATRQALAIFGAEALAGAEHLRSGDRGALGASMNAAQRAYDELLAPNLPALRAPGLTAATAALREAGALGAKFSGAGGDGSVVALFDDDEGAARGVERLRALGLSALQTPLAP